MRAFARAVAVYRELRNAFGPWAKDRGWRRAPKTDAAWTDGTTLLSFHVAPWGGGVVGGSSFYGYLQPSDHSRQVDLSLCLETADLAELARLQTGINRRRPRNEDIAAWLREDSPVGAHTREMYADCGPAAPGRIVAFGYYGMDDVQAHAGFLLPRLGAMIERYSSGQDVKPVPVDFKPFGMLIRGN